jgi:superfamily II DNA or RNA helicase
MLLKVHPHVTYASDFRNGRERKHFGEALRFLDPNRFKEPRFQQGTWDGIRSAFLDTDRTKFSSGYVHWVLRWMGKEQWDVEVERIGAADNVGTEVSPDIFEYAGITLRDYQIEATQQILKKRRGVIKLPPRSGKTIVALAAHAILDTKTVILVEKGGLLRQHLKSAQDLDIEVGAYGQGMKDLSNNLTIATLQSIYRAMQDGNDEVRKWAESVQFVVIDECHHLSGPTFAAATMLFTSAHYRIGLSATPYYSLPDQHTQRRPFHWNDFLVVGLTGPVLYESSSEEMREAGTIARAKVQLVNVTSKPMAATRDWHVIYKKGIVENEERNTLIAEQVKTLCSEGHIPLILVSQVKHGIVLLQKIKELGLVCGFAIGSSGWKTVLSDGSVVTERKTIPEVAEELEEGCWDAVLATTVVDEGIDFPCISAVVMAGGGKSSIKTIQRSYRALTATEGKEFAVIVDFVDMHSNTLLRHSSERVAAYRSEGLPILTASPVGM